MHTEDRLNLRKRLLAEREKLTKAQCEQLSAQIRAALSHAFAELSQQRVAFYWPIRNEPDLRPLMREWAARAEPGFSALLPVIAGKHAPLVFRRWHEESVMATDRYGIPYPAEGEPVIPQALIIPCVACDTAGYRLGYGGGYYDRTLAILPPETRRIGVGYAFSSLPSIFPQVHDMQMDAWVTEYETVRIK